MIFIRATFIVILCVLSGILGLVLDYICGISFPPIFWSIGLVSGYICGIIALWRY